MNSQLGISSAKKIAALTVGSGLTVLSNVIFGAVASRVLDKSAYATVRQTFLAFDFFLPFLLLGVPGALFYLLPRADEEQLGVLVDTLAIVFAGAVMFSLFVALGGSELLAARFNNPSILSTAMWLLPYAFATMPIALMPAVLVWAGRHRDLAVFKVSSALMIAVGGALSAAAFRNGGAVVSTRALLSVALMPIGIWMLVRSVPGRRYFPTRAGVAEVVRTGAPIAVAGSVGILTVQLHSIIVAFLATPADFAVYINGAVELPLIGVVTGSITAVLLSDMSAACARGNTSDALALFRQAAVRSACVLLPALVFFLLVAEDFIVLLYSERYRDSTVPFMTYLLILPARIVVFSAALTAIGRAREIAIRSVVDLVLNAVLCYWLVSRFGYVGAALGLVVTVYVWTVPFNIFRIARAYSVPWTRVLPFRRIGVIGAASVGSLLPTALLYFALQEALLPLRLVLTALFFCGVVLFAFRWIDVLHVSLRPRSIRWGGET